MTYRSHSIWERSNEGLYRYRVLENLITGKYSVLMRDSFGGRSSVPRDLLLNLDKYFVELLIEMTPEERGGAFDTIQDAIRAFDEDFRSDVEPDTGTEGQ
jgi:hypothetical protein